MNIQQKQTNIQTKQIHSTRNVELGLLTLSVEEA